MVDEMCQITAKILHGTLHGELLQMPKMLGTFISTWLTGWMEDRNLRPAQSRTLRTTTMMAAVVVSPTIFVVEDAILAHRLRAAAEGVVAQEVATARQEGVTMLCTILGATLEWALIH